jgi:hypothetical protein
MKNTILSILFVCSLNLINAQSESGTTDIQEISETLMLYIDGTQNGKPEKLKKAFVDRNQQFTKG